MRTIQDGRSAISPSWKPSRPFVVLALAGLGLALGWHASTGHAADAAVSLTGTKRAYANGRFIVKFKPSITQCAHCLLARGQAFRSALTDRSDSLDRLNQQFGVREARSLFIERHAMTTTQANNRAAQLAQALKARFASRTRRAAVNRTLPDLTNLYVVTVPETTNIEVLCQRYQADPHVEYAHPDYVQQASFLPNDPSYHSQGSWGQPYDDLWALKAGKLNMAPAWDLSQGRGIIVAVVDTGVDYTHPDIAMNIWRNPGELPSNGRDDDGNGFVDDIRGWDFTTCRDVLSSGDCAGPKKPQNDPMDDSGHGTHVAGIIAAVGNNTLGIIGVAPQATVMPLKSLTHSGHGLSSEVAGAMYYAANNGADVINASLAGNADDVKDAIRYAHALGVVLVFSAGNTNGFMDPSGYASMGETIAVGATTETDFKAPFSNVGPAMDVAAPGGSDGGSPNILSLRSSAAPVSRDSNQSVVHPELIVADRYLRLQGTSMATPYVSGIAALILAHRPLLPNEGVRQALHLGSDDVRDNFIPGFDLATGYGRVNAYGALLMDEKAAFDFQLADWNRDGWLDLFAIKKNHTGSNSTEVHVLSGGSNVRFTLALAGGASPFQRFILQTGTALHETWDNFTFRVGDWDHDGYPDLIAIKKDLTGTRAFTEVHVLSGASNFQRFILQTPAELGRTFENSDFDVGDWDGDRRADLIRIEKRPIELGGRFEMSIFPGAANFSFPGNSPLRVAIPQVEIVNPARAGGQFTYQVADWDHDGRLDLFEIQKNLSSSTQVRILSGASNFQSSLLHTNTPLHNTGRNFVFDVQDWNRDGWVDLIAIKKNQTGSHSTEVHILSGATNFQQFILQTGTSLHETY